MTNSPRAAPAPEPSRLGSTLPRYATPPLATGPPGDCPCRCALTAATSYGFDVIRFAERIGIPLDPWQQLAAIHIGELLPDGRPRFRYMLILVARQNGKTLLAKVLVLYWMFVARVPLTLHTSTDRKYAKRFWSAIVKLVKKSAQMSPYIGKDAVRLTIGEESFTTLDGSELLFAANNGSAGRSTTLNRWLCDELREHRTRECWDAADGAMSAVADAQGVFISNQGADDAIVLDSLRGPALTYIKTGVGEQNLGLLEWSSPEELEADDLEGLALANPNMGRPGHGPDPDALQSAARAARVAGGLVLSGFITERLCRRVEQLDPAIEPASWTAAGAAGIEDLAEHRDRVALCLDVSLGADHVALIAGALIDGAVHLDVVKAWAGPGCTRAALAELPAIVARVQPRSVGWFPSGPAAAIIADLQERRGVWPPRRADGRRVQLTPITADTPAACMSLADMVRAGQIRHPGDPMLDAHVDNSQRQETGDRWVFGRRGAGPVNGTYAAAGAAYLARTLPPPPPPLSAA